MGKSSPQPGHPVRGSRSGRPIMVLLDQLGRRWCMRILWELRDEPLNFRDLQAACDGASPSVLNTRLRELRNLKLIRHNSGRGYALTTQGRELLALFAPLGNWAEQWAAALTENDPG